MGEEELIRSAMSFLKNPKVVTEDKEKIRQFLRGKGLSDENIAEAYKRVAEAKAPMVPLANLPKTLPMMSPLNLIKLNVSHQGLSSLPVLAQNSSLKVLVASFNAITSIPKEVSMLNDLEILNISNNKIDDLNISAEFFTLHSLKQLNFSNNQVALLQPFCGLVSLEQLNLSENLIEEIPDSIANLQNLRYLWLARNKISSLPRSLLLLQSLQQLVFFN